MHVIIWNLNLNGGNIEDDSQNSDSSGDDHDNGNNSDDHDGNYSNSDVDEVGGDNKLFKGTLQTCYKTCLELL